TDVRDFESKAARYVKERNFSKKANEEMKIYNLKMKVSRLEMIEAHIDLELIALTDEMDQLINDRLMEVGMDELKRQSGILGGSFEMDKHGVKYISSRKFHGDDFSSRLWKNKRILHDELEKRLTESIIRGQHPREAARKLRKRIE